MSDEALMNEVKDDVQQYIDALRTKDPHGSADSYDRLFRHLCDLTYEMRMAEKMAITEPQDGRMTARRRHSRSAA